MMAQKVSSDTCTFGGIRNYVQKHTHARAFDVVTLVDELCVSDLVGLFSDTPTPRVTGALDMATAMRLKRLQKKKPRNKRVQVREILL